MVLYEANGVHFLLGLVQNPPLVAMIASELAHAEAESRAHRLAVLLRTFRDLVAGHLEIAILQCAGMLDARKRGLDPFCVRSLRGIPRWVFRNGHKNDVQNADYNGSGQCRQKPSSNLVVHGRPSNDAATSPLRRFCAFL
jgi:hypothetical protein